MSEEGGVCWQKKRVIKGLRTAGSQGRENLLQVAFNLI